MLLRGQVAYEAPESTEVVHAVHQRGRGAVLGAQIERLHDAQALVEHRKRYGGMHSPWLLLAKLSHGRLRQTVVGKQVCVRPNFPRKLFVTEVSERLGKGLNKANNKA
jgi:hypothetical protein